MFKPYRPLFLSIGVLFLLLAYRKIYRAPVAQTCTTGSLCAMLQANQVDKILFWMVAVLIGLAIAFFYVAPLFY